MRCYFYPRSPCGERQPIQANILKLYRYFYPRSPCGERLIALFDFPVVPAISIHALLAESDTRGEHHASSQQEFLSTLSLRRATVLELQCILGGWYFYPRSPCGERPVPSGGHINKTDFYPRSPCGERLLGRVEVESRM